MTGFAPLGRAIIPWTPSILSSFIAFDSPKCFSNEDRGTVPRGTEGARQTQRDATREPCRRAPLLQSYAPTLLRSCAPALLRSRAPKPLRSCPGKPVAQLLQIRLADLGRLARGECLVGGAVKLVHDVG